MEPVYVKGPGDSRVGAAAEGETPEVERSNHEQKGQDNEKNAADSLGRALLAARSYLWQR